MKVVFVGTSEFAVPVLERLHKMVDIPLVITQPDRPRGRGRKVTPTPVKSKAIELGLRVISPERIEEAKPEIEVLSPDILVVVSYGQLVPKDILEIPKIGCLNVHPSLLPKYRGAAPIQRAIMNGERLTGVTIIWMNERLDAGDIFLQREVPIKDDETYGELHERLSQISAEMMEEAVERVKNNEIIKIPQDESLSTYAKPISKEETFIDWNEDAVSIHNKIRALSPKPGAVALISGRRFKIYRSKVSSGKGSPGSILEKDIKKGVLKIACGRESIELLYIQPEGKRVMDVASFLRGYGDKL